MTERRDYYDVLGVARDADTKTIKDAFRKLALRYHPDRSAEADAEERFKEIAEAYAVLSKPERRASYDARGFGGVAGFRPEDLFAGVDFEDLFGDLGFDFGGLGTGGPFDRLFGRGRRRGPPRGADVEALLEIPLEMVATGGEQRIVVEHPRRCERCEGSGAKPGTEPRRCAACDGQGRKSTVSDQGNVHFQSVETCSACRGRGHFIDEPCDACSGRGEVAASETLKVKIPIGVDEGMVLRVAGKGGPAPDGGGAPGDLLVVVRTREDPRFERRGPQLWRVQQVDLTDAVLGATVRVPTLDGHARLEIPPRTQPGTVLRMHGKGLPAFGGKSRGDLHVAMQVRVPESLSSEEERLWKQLRRLKAKRSP